MRSWRRLATWVLTVSLAACAADAALAQDYFGQNKVRYQSFDFQVLKTEHFDIYYYPETRDAVAVAARMAERWYARLSRALQHDLSRRQPLILYASHPAFEQTNAIYGELGEGVGGVTEAFKRRIVIPFAGPLAETDHVIGHELVHAFQYDIVGQGRSQTIGLNTAARLPMWFMEGMAEYLSIGAVDPHTAMWMRDAAQSNRLPNFGKLEDPRYFPYRFGQALWAYLTGRFGEDAVARMLKAAGRSGDVRQAMQTTFGVQPDSLVKDWHQALRDWEQSLVPGTDPPSKEATPLVVSKKGGGHMNLSPSLSPDGSRVVFFSERSLISIEMYLADAKTGRILRQLTRAAVDPEIQNLGFISSSGEWSPDGRRFAFATASRGRPVISIADGRSGRLLRRIRLPKIGEAFHPTWSPDGRRIAFAALTGGLMDLYTVEVASGRTERLTSDGWADLQPAWSPDGRTIAFVTDRFGRSATPGDTSYGHYRLALMDVTTRAIRPLHTFDRGKSINPQWSPDGASLYFVGDPDGIPDLYRVRLGTDAVEPMTRLLTGVSGITRLSPAVSVARSTGEVVFSAYEGGSFDLFRLDPQRAVQPVESTSVPRTSGGVPVTQVLPPIERSLALIPGADSTAIEVAAVDTMRFSSARYHPRFSLDYVAQPSIGVAAGSGGVGVGGGAGLYWSDMLGDRQLATLLQIANVGGSVWNNTAAAVGYTNLASRWNWGLQVSQIPYITTGFLDNGYSNDANGNLRYSQSELRTWEIYRDLEGSVAYPFSRFQRLELSAGLRNISFAQQLETWSYDPVTGAQVADDKQNLPAPASLNLATGGIALVYDSGVFGGTSPVLGQRYRFELNQTAGTIRMNEALADYRRYVPVVRPLVFAARVLHYGRYGRGADDERLSPVFVGYPWLIRGYDDTSISNDLAAAPDSATYNRLFSNFRNLVGSRIAVANAELRLPLLGALGIIPSAGFPPVETALFFDAGSAWTSRVRPHFLGGSLQPVTSYGVAFRMNLFGFAVGEADLVHPNDRPNKSWYWELSLQPGF